MESIKKKFTEADIVTRDVVTITEMLNGCASENEQLKCENKSLKVEVERLKEELKNKSLLCDCYSSDAKKARSIIDIIQSTLKFNELL